MQGAASREGARRTWSTLRPFTAKRNVADGLFTESSKLIVIDNYDSFTHNLVQMFMEYPLAIEVFRADRIEVDFVIEKRPDYLLISPGPKGPDHSGISTRLISAAAGRIPILGVCLGMQCINAVFGGRTIRAPVPVHGKTSRVFHDNTGIFAGMPEPFTAARYHSLAVDSSNTRLSICAKSEDNVIMGIADQDNKIFGVQFHPESFMTECGFIMVENFLATGPLAKTLFSNRRIHADALLFDQSPDFALACGRTPN
ncbi:MAG: aminodeoxychorismate/anthranilate synthase component II [Deltaproteobacteria bacterium]|nr:aminodeoxychorismate/anthranilate synthase component II [Deltaproteobacteria bacterium]